MQLHGTSSTDTCPRLVTSSLPTSLQMCLPVPIQATIIPVLALGALSSPCYCHRVGSHTDRTTPFSLTTSLALIRCRGSQV